MAKKYTCYVIPDNTSAPRKFTVSLSLIVLLFLLISTMGAAAGFFAQDYFVLRDKASRALALENRIAVQKEEISLQRAAILKYAGQINKIQNTLTGMRQLEQKVRVMTDLSIDSAGDGVLGIGGAIPMELETRLPLSQSYAPILRDMNDSVKELSAISLGQQDRFRELVKGIEAKKDLLACTPSIRPVDGWVSSRFGLRNSPFTGAREGHKGLDISAPRGTTIQAPANGRVVFVGLKGALGRVVVIDHGHGIVTRYAHLSKSLSRIGQWVKRGDAIAEVGSTGRSTGSHLHYEVLVDGAHVNPEKYIYN